MKLLWSRNLFNTASLYVQKTNNHGIECLPTATVFLKSLSCVGRLQNRITNIQKKTGSLLGKSSNHLFHLAVIPSLVRSWDMPFTTVNIVMVPGYPSELVEQHHRSRLTQHKRSWYAVVFGVYWICEIASSAAVVGAVGRAVQIWIQCLPDNTCVKWSATAGSGQCPVTPQLCSSQLPQQCCSTCSEHDLVLSQLLNVFFFCFVFETTENNTTRDMHVQLMFWRWKRNMPLWEGGTSSKKLVSVRNVLISSHSGREEKLLFLAFLFLAPNAVYTSLNWLLAFCIWKVNETDKMVPGQMWHCQCQWQKGDA